MIPLENHRIDFVPCADQLPLIVHLGPSEILDDVTINGDELGRRHHAIGLVVHVARRVKTFHGLLQHDPVEPLRNLGYADQFARDVRPQRVAVLGHRHQATAVRLDENLIAGVRETRKQHDVVLGIREQSGERLALVNQIGLEQQEVLTYVTAGTVQRIHASGIGVARVCGPIELSRDTGALRAHTVLRGVP